MTIRTFEIALKVPRPGPDIGDITEQDQWKKTQPESPRSRSKILRGDSWVLGHG